MEQFCARTGKIRSIGLSNWYVEELAEPFCRRWTPLPALVQNEIPPYYQENDVIPFIQETKALLFRAGIRWAAEGTHGELLGDPVIC